MDKPLLHIISHTDLDGVAAAALAWHVHHNDRLVRISLTGYGDVDMLILETLAAGQEPLVLDLFCQREQTVDEIDKLWNDARRPFLFDHHKSTFERYGNRKWAVIDTNYCGALVYWRWLRENAKDERTQAVLAELEPVMKIANDRDLWLGEMPESRLWQALVTMCGQWGMLARLMDNPRASSPPWSWLARRSSRSGRRRASRWRRSISGARATNWRLSATACWSTATSPISAA